MSRAVQGGVEPRVVLVAGPSGSGKTTLLEGLVSALQDEKDDEALSKLYPRLRFLNIDQMNDFLLQLTGLLLPAEDDLQVSPLPQFSEPRPSPDHKSPPRSHPVG